MTGPRTMPGGLPGVGHLAHLVRRPLEFLRDAQACGDVVRVRLGPQQAYFVNQPAALRAMLVDHPQDFDKGVHFDKAKTVIGDSLPASSGAFHRRQRKIARPAFATAMLTEYFETMRECTAAAVARWDADTDLHAELRNLISTITIRTLYSLESADAATEELADLIDPLEAGVTRLVLDPTGLLSKLPTKANREFSHAVRRTRELVTGFIAESRAAGGDRRDLLSVLADGDMPDDQLRDEAVAIMQAGVETTAQTLRWTCHLLADHPAWMERLQREAAEILSGREIGYDDVDKFDVTRRVLLEALRMYPPLYFLSRRALVDVELGGHQLPAGSMILFSAYAAQRNPMVYRDPDVFDPDRWLEDAPPPISYLPFGAGLRSCLGERFAMIEMITIMAGLAQRFSVRRVRPVDPKATFVLSVRPGGTRLEAR